jgi:hypothetical protein
MAFAKTTWPIVRRSRLIVLMTVGGYLILAPNPGFWFRIPLGIYTCGSAVLWLAFDRRFANGGRLAGFSMARGYRIACAAYIVAGACTLIGAFASLPVAFAWIITPFVLTWTSMWVWMLRESSRPGYWQPHS